MSGQPEGIDDALSEWSTFLSAKNIAIFNQKRSINNEILVSDDEIYVNVLFLPLKLSRKTQRALNQT